MNDKTQSDFRDLMKRGSRREAYDLLMSNPYILGHMTLNEASEAYASFIEAIPSDELMGLVRLIVKRGTGRDYKIVTD